MRCNDARQHWELYHDSEGDSELYLEINDHLAECPNCAKWFFRQGRLEDLVELKLRNAAPTGELWSRIHDQCGLSPAVASRSWLTFSPLLSSPLLAVVAALLLAVGLWYFGGQRAAGNVPHLSALTSVCHQRLIGGDQPLEFVSQSDREVETYLKSRVPFPVHCPPRKDAGFVVRGGGVCTIAGQAAAYVSGDVEGEDVSIFILPKERLTHFTHERDILNRVAFHHCREGDYDMVLAKIDRNVLVVIGRAPPERLERVVRAYGTYHGTPAGEAVAPQTEVSWPDPHLPGSGQTGSGVVRDWDDNSWLTSRIESRDSCNSTPGPFVLSMPTANWRFCVGCVESCETHRTAMTKFKTPNTEGSPKIEFQSQSTRRSEFVIPSCLRTSSFVNYSRCVSQDSTHPTDLRQLLPPIVISV